ncbi:MAG: phenylalanine--tRNA ligase subunit alpha [Candidatus Omnitrophica bacterium]|nr:phenylalanine--tRNA ligase subunit alpha [Candidatus Omnitrophota bacterium]
MHQKIENIRKEFLREIKRASTPAQIQDLKIKYLGRKGEVTQLLKEIKDISSAERTGIGKLINDFKKEINQSIAQCISSLSKEVKEKKGDITLPGTFSSLGHLHPLTQIINQIEDIFQGLNFRIVDGPEIEDEYYNFEALNIPLEHPSRDAFDTFYLKSPSQRLLLRSQTSPVQIRIMEKEKPPLRIISSGKVYRPDAIDASHSCMFHQVEGFMVDEEVSFADLKGMLSIFIKEMFGKEIEMRFRPHYFPFTEPSAEVDISCLLCKGKGCSACGNKGWIEILGAGMISPKVFERVGYNPDKVSGFAFGMGVERIAMLKFNIRDIRLFFENDIRFLQQF